MPLNSYTDLKLDQHSLIQASAGTGKTYSLVRMALRYIVEQKTPLNKIVLVTFTNAAATELKARLANLIKEERQNNPTNQTLLEAQKNFNHLTVGTIHSFCQKVLSSYSFENGGLFLRQLNQDTSWQTELVLDFFRKEERNFDTLMQNAFLSFAQLDNYDRTKIAQHLVKLINNHYNLGKLTPSYAQQQKIIELIHHYNRQQGALYTATLALLALNKEDWQNIFSKIKKNNSTITSLLNQLPFVETSDVFQFLSLFSKKEWEDLQKFIKYQDNTIKLTEAEKQQLSFIMAFINELSPLMPNQEESCPPYLSALRAFFVRTVLPPLQQKIDQTLQSNGHFNFDTLIYKTHQLITQTHSALLKALQNRYNVVLIDEFQDTNLLQWQIFKAIFNSPQHSMVLVGDPKQAIYSFRGANLDTYFDAIKTVPRDNYCVLDTSYRSHPNLVQGINQWFTAIYQNHPQIHFTPLKAKQESTIVSLQAEQRFISFIEAEKTDQDKFSKSNVMQQYAYTLANLLKNGSLAHNNGERPLKANDIAILCRTNDDLKPMKTLLNQLGIPSVVYKKESVWGSPAAEWLLLFLEVLSTPRNEKLARTLLLTPLYNYSQEFLQQANLSGYFVQLYQYQQLASQNKWPLLLNQLMQDSQYFERLLANQNNENRERNYSDMQHLLQLTANLSSPTAYQAHHLYKAFKRHINQYKHTEEEAIRLENDNEAVHLLTLHGAKGLEYPVVFLLYLNQPQPDKDPYYVVKTASGSTLDFTKSQTYKQQLEQQNLNEEKNLFYVGATRAKSLLLLPAQSDSKSYYANFLQQLNPKVSTIFYHQAPIPPENREKSSVPPSSVLNLTTFKTPRNFKKETEVTSSYSSLWQTDQTNVIATEPFLKPNDEELSSSNQNDEELTPLTLKGNSDVGTFVHSIFESLSFNLANQPFDDFCNHTEVLLLMQQLALNSVGQEWLKTNQNIILQMVWHTLNQKLNALNGLQLATLPSQNYKAELEFLLPVKQDSFLYLNHYKGFIQHGYLVGFIDLIFLHNNQYYILDWKTTQLGDSLEAYQPSSLQPAMNHHGYTLQYYIYLYALELYGKSLDPSFSYTNHIGGVVYAFTRATNVNQTNDTGFFIYKPPLQDYQNFTSQLGFMQKGD